MPDYYALGRLLRFEVRTPWDDFSHDSAREAGCKIRRLRAEGLDGYGRSEKEACSKRPRQSDAITSPPSGCEGGSNPRAVEHARHTQKKANRCRVAFLGNARALFSIVLYSSRKLTSIVASTVT